MRSRTSVGRLWVTVVAIPAGPFVDSGRRLTQEQFAIDPHGFVDDDGARYLFYATDFLEHTHIGTGTVQDHLPDPFTLAGQPRPVTRARYDWQVFDPQCAEKGGVRWHTVEGSFVLKHKGRYYHMFSGGNWKSTIYGVSDPVERPDECEQVADGRWLEQQIALSQAFIPDAFHLVRLEVDGGEVHVALDDVAVRWGGRLDKQPRGVTLLTQGMAAALTPSDIKRTFIALSFPVPSTTTP